jgi:hypothetical protein
MTSPSERSIPELFGDAVGQLAKLIGNEFALARAELAEKAAQASRAMAMIVMGAGLMMPAVVMLLFAGSSLLIDYGFSDATAYLLVGGIAALGAFSLIAVGIGRLSGDALKPSELLDQVELDKSAAKEMIR